MRIRKANPRASLRMTGWLELPQRLKPLPNSCALRGAEAPLFHGAVAVCACNLRSQDQKSKAADEACPELAEGSVRSTTGPPGAPAPHRDERVRTSAAEAASLVRGLMRHEWNSCPSRSPGFLGRDGAGRTPCRDPGYGLECRDPLTAHADS